MYYQMYAGQTSLKTADSLKLSTLQNSDINISSKSKKNKIKKKKKKKKKKKETLYIYMLPKISILIVGLVRLFLSGKIYCPFLNRGKREEDLDVN